jgi:hypothetical protein
MSIWHRTPREVYRVYGEDQYLEADIAAREEAATSEPDSAAEASSSAFATDAASPSPRTAASRSALPSGPHAGGLLDTRPHAGRLVGVGLLMGVSLATLALVFLNASHPRGAATEPFAQGARVEVGQRAARASGARSAPRIAQSESRMPAHAPRFSASGAMTSVPASGSRLQQRVPTGSPDPAPRIQRVSSAALRPSGNAPPASVAVQPPAPVTLEPPARGGVEPSTPVAAEPSVQDEFGFEQ